MAKFKVGDWVSTAGGAYKPYGKAVWGYIVDSLEVDRGRFEVYHVQPHTFPEGASGDPILYSGASLVAAPPPGAPPLKFYPRQCVRTKHRPPLDGLPEQALVWGRIRYLTYERGKWWAIIGGDMDCQSAFWDDSFTVKVWVEKIEPAAFIPFKDPWHSCSDAPD